MFTLENISGFLAFATSLIGLLPQIYKVHKSKSSNDISILMLINYSICSMAWVIHGILTGSDYVTYSNIFGLFTAIISIIQKIKYSG